ncbi:zeta toxin family protein [Merismopedia glauca]|uniref:UDP-N-acetylglucosamine kinase n=1 Tax=Merismopedia glauca CCAP 1448/3 TaxID=1296344 RepID=A0A2T1BXE5_9CYAN|nr:zeta toxin family protein [Merismopedia glauca]PSB00685.1 hypothetical protein C7B64_22245 [Merismopedia glauca CCAP 1448/3]
MTGSTPTIVIIAGPNGAGKSTLTRIIEQSNQIYPFGDDLIGDFTQFPAIDPDAEARLIQPNRPEAAALQGGKQALKRAYNYLANGQSFLVETTLAGKTYFRLIQQARQLGWRVYLIYIGVERVEISIDRVAQRAIAGGHNVALADIRRRYERSLSHLKRAVEMVDLALIFDNSAKQGYKKMMTVERGQVREQAELLPQWLIAAWEG